MRFSAVHVEVLAVVPEQLSTDDTIPLFLERLIILELSVVQGKEMTYSFFLLNFQLSLPFFEISNTR